MEKSPGEQVAAYLERMRAAGQYGACQHCGRERPLLPEFKERGLDICQRCADKATGLEVKEHVRLQAMCTAAFWRAWVKVRGAGWFLDRDGVHKGVRVVRG